MTTITYFTLDQIESIAQAEGGKVWINPTCDRDIRVYLPMPKLPKREYSNIYARVKIYFSRIDNMFTVKNVYDMFPANQRVIMQLVSDLNDKYDLTTKDWGEW